MNSIQSIFVLIPPMLLAITLHEYAHGRVAVWLGDSTPEDMGRLSPNPLRHLDLVGTAVFIMTGIIGWAKPVPVDVSRLKNGERSMVWVAFAGPLSNILLAILSAILYRAYVSFDYIFFTHAFSFSLPLLLMLKTSIAINIALAIFNLIPILPLDGGRIVLSLVPERYYGMLLRLEAFGPLLLILLIITNSVDHILSPILSYALSRLI